MYRVITKDVKLSTYSYFLVSTTARASAEINRLPDKNIKGQLAINYLITNERIAREIFREIDGHIDNVLIDVEGKKEIDLMGIAIDVLRESRILPYKPNDVTLEAADQLILNRLGFDLSDKKVLVYGTGNIAFKLALRLLEREVDVAILGRNREKTGSLVTTLNMIKPKYARAIAREHTADTSPLYDGFVSFISSEKVIDASMASYIKEDGFAIDGGIGNFQGEFIAKSLENNVSVLRLDVRLGNPFLLAGINSLSSENEFFETVMGSQKLDNINLVAGGIIGESGSIILDQIKSPTQIIGIANGYGGLKNEEQFTNDDWANLQYAKETLV